MRTLVLAGLVLLASPATPQTVADALRNASKPITAAELPDAYRAVTLGGEGMGSMSSLVVYGMSAGRANEDKASQMLFNLMGTTFVDPDEFAALLDGKRPRIRGYVLDLTTMMAGSVGGGRTPRPLFTEAWIEAGRIVQWSPKPGVSKESILAVFGKGDKAGDSPADQTAGLSNVKQVSLAMVLYAGDYDDFLPYAPSSAKAKEIVMPYTKNESIWTSPNGGRILYNTSLSGLSMIALEAPAETLLAWEEKAYPDGSRGVGYVDGHAARRDATQWDETWKAELARRAKAKANAAKMKRLISSQDKPKG